MGWGCGVSGCKHFHVDWINNKVLLWSTGTYVQYHGINHDGREYKTDCKKPKMKQKISREDRCLPLAGRWARDQFSSLFKTRVSILLSLANAQSTFIPGCGPSWIFIGSFLHDGALCLIPQFESSVF